MRKWTKIVGLLAIAAVTTAWNEMPITYEDRKIGLDGYEVDGFELWRNRNSGRTWFVEYAWWGWNDGDYQIQTRFQWGGEYGTHWNKDEIYREGVLKYNALSGSRAKGISAGPLLATVHGDIDTLAFDNDYRTPVEGDRQCIGFRVWWDSYRDSYTKMLDFYACAKDGESMTGDEFVEILRRLSLAGEFDSLLQN